MARSRGLDARDRGLLRRLIGTEVRRRGTLRALVAHFTRGKPSPAVAAHLRLGMAQLFFLDRVPAHAAISETVRATADTVGLPRGRYVNGVLRSAQRAARSGHCDDPRRDLPDRPWHFADPVFRDPEAHPHLWAEDALSLPAALMKHWSARYGPDRARALATLALEEPDLSLVVLGPSTRDAARAELEAAGVPTREGRHPAVLLAAPPHTESVLASAPFAQGRITVQGESALRAAELVGAGPGERVLDLCAAPGGKACLLASSGATVLACDANPTRLAPLAANLARVAPSATVHSLVADGTTALTPDATFDAVLLDAPCSNTGVLAARPGARWRFGPASQRELTALQSRLLRQAADHVRPGGRLVYSTCSLEPEENGRLVRAFLEARDGWTLDEECEDLPHPAGDGGPLDGGYRVRLLHRDPSRPGTAVP